MSYQEQRNDLMIEPPSECPSCQSSLLLIKDTLYCQNKECPAQSSKQIEHFSKTLKIKGLGPATIDKLMLEGIPDIYKIDLGYATTLLGSVKLAVKLLDEIERSKKEPLNTVLPAFGIALIGKTATEKLSQVCDSIFDIDEAVCKRAGLGPKASANLLNWLEENEDYISELPFNFEFEKKSSATQERGVICISGKLKSFKTKAEATQLLEGLGYRVKDSLTKDVTILLNESGIESAKTVKAANSGIRIVNNIQEIIGE
jgi:DNA ligase (NAD+)